jgi:hypothetical protein
VQKVATIDFALLQLPRVSRFHARTYRPRVSFLLRTHVHFTLYTGLQSTMRSKRADCNVASKTDAVESTIGMTEHQNNASTETHTDEIELEGIENPLNWKPFPKCTFTVNRRLQARN